MDVDYLGVDTTALYVERRQLADAGRPVEAVGDELDALAADVARDGAATHRARGRELLDRCRALPEERATEPASLGAIRDARPDGPRVVDAGLEADRDRLAGAWAGRCAGCRLGKPVETWSREQIRAFLSATDQTLDGYLRADVPGSEGFDLNATGGWDDRTEGMPRDDDVDFALAALAALRRAGDAGDEPSLTTEAVARTWVERLPAGALHTAERVAYRNVLNGVEPGETARRHNPYREFIGAQIRGDCYGYVAPGRPERAAGLAYRDARLSHVRNGVYGAMWVAATLAAVPAVADLREAVRVGLTEVPDESRLAARIGDVLRWRADGVGYRTAVDRIHADWDDADAYEGYHVLPNAQVVAATLSWTDAETGFGTAVGRAVRAGFDTDCNAATVGSAVGLRRGYNALPEPWRRPLARGVRTALAGRGRPDVETLAAETAAVAA